MRFCFSIVLYRLRLFKTAFVIKNVLLNVARILAEKRKKKVGYFFAVGKRAAEIFFVKFFDPCIDGKTVRAMIAEKSDAIGDFRSDAFKRDEFFS